MGIRAVLIVDNKLPQELLGEWVGGLPLLSRLLLSLRHAGVEEVSVAGKIPPRLIPADGGLRIPAVVPLEGQGFAEGPAPVLFLPVHGVVLHQALQPLPRGAVPEGLSYLLAPGVLLASPKVAETCRQNLLEGNRWDGILQNLEAWGMVERPGGMTGAWLPVRTAGERDLADRILFRSLGKETDGFMARHVDRHISRAMSRLLARTSVTPNQVSIGVLIVGLLGAWGLTHPTTDWRLAGAALFLLSSILDGVDGEIARLKFLESRLGGRLDLIVDNVIHVALFGGIGVGLYRESGLERYLVLGGLGMLGTALSAGSVLLGPPLRKGGEGPFFTSVAEGKGDGGGWQRALVRLSDAMARRDFAYALIPLAWVGWLGPCLWAAALGSNLYFVGLLFLRLTPTLR
jgi:hypothetical protein